MGLESILNSNPNAIRLAKGVSQYSTKTSMSLSDYLKTPWKLLLFPLAGHGGEWENLWEGT